LCEISPIYQPPGLTRLCVLCKREDSFLRLVDIGNQQRTLSLIEISESHTVDEFDLCQRRLASDLSQASHTLIYVGFKFLRVAALPTVSCG
jgi:hypothetical protein